MVGLIDLARVDRLNLTWVNSGWYSGCPFRTVDLSNEQEHGVYIIWKELKNKSGRLRPNGLLAYQHKYGDTIYVGKGNIAERIRSHQSSKEITAQEIRQFDEELYENPLLVTWAEVNPSSAEHVERYLAKELRPKVGRHNLIGPCVLVNKPFLPKFRLGLEELALAMAEQPFDRKHNGMMPRRLSF